MNLFVRLYNRTGPAEDRDKLELILAQFAARVSGLAGSAPNPAEYGRQVADRLCPIMLPYELGSDAAFDFAGFNGRALGDDVMDIILTLVSNVPLTDGVVPDRTRMRSDFPYFGCPFQIGQKAGVTPVQARPPAANNRPESPPSQGN